MIRIARDDVVAQFGRCRRSAVSGAQRRAAKTEFKAAWKALKASTTPEQLAAAYKAMNIRDDD
jgi:hypothetical protein